ncbi:MAG: hypothetical protein U5J95_12485 [Balneolaceae bacterium]|nr:hypothetical protein [Balneolaceae bacterium]
MKVADIPDEDTYDLSAKNPNTPEEDPLRSPEEILDEMEMLDEETQSLMHKYAGVGMRKDWAQEN